MKQLVFNREHLSTTEEGNLVVYICLRCLGPLHLCNQQSCTALHHGAIPGEVDINTLCQGTDTPPRDVLCVKIVQDPLFASTSDLLAACKLSHQWLVNCIPVVDLPGEKPLPVLSAVISEAEGTE